MEQKTKSTKEVAKMFGMRPSTIHVGIYNGRFSAPRKTARGQYVWSESDIEKISKILGQANECNTVTPSDTITDSHSEKICKLHEKVDMTKNIYIRPCKEGGFIAYGQVFDMNKAIAKTEYLALMMFLETQGIKISRDTSPVSIPKFAANSSVINEGVDINKIEFLSSNMKVAKADMKKSKGVKHVRTIKNWSL